jgi:hypothetical protein
MGEHALIWLPKESSIEDTNQICDKISNLFQCLDWEGEEVMF